MKTDLAVQMATTPEEQAWQGMLRQLTLFAREHGHAFVPMKSREFPLLGDWLSRQVRLQRQGKLAVARQTALERIGVEWDFDPAERAKMPRDNTDRWQERLMQLADFQKKHGHLHVTLKNQTHTGLMHWRDNQRLRLKSGAMTPEQKARLDALGFEWEAPGLSERMREEYWRRMLGMLLEFKSRFGHTHVPPKWSENRALAKWVARMRRQKREGSLPREREARLEELGFSWKAVRQQHESRWEERFAQLAAFKEKHGHLHVTLKNQTHAGLMHWRDNQRLRLKSGVMTPEQKERLEALGFEWEAPGLNAKMKDERWERMFGMFVAHKERAGSAHVVTQSKENPELARWVLRMREHNNQGILPPERRASLDAAGFVWKSELLHFKAAWEWRFAQLAAFKDTHGHLHVTLTNQTHPGLAHWRDNQRLRLKSGALTPDQKARLDALGFDWQPPGIPTANHQPARAKAPKRGPVDDITLWEHGFSRLLQFHHEHGHARVPHHWLADPALEQWAREQRSARSYGRLHLDQISRLDALGFHWLTPAEEHWLNRLEALRAFHAEHGHCRVPKKHPLRNWLEGQREAFRDDRLLPARRALLEKLDWLAPAPRVSSAPLSSSAGPSVWEQRFEQLMAFHAAHGHFRVPKRVLELKTLSEWVKAQRVYHRKGTLPPQKAARLEQTGFPWAPGRWRGKGPRVQDASPRPKATGAPPAFQQRVAQLIAFKEQTGHVNYPVKKSPDQKLGNWVSNVRISHRLGQLNAEKTALLEQIGFQWVAGHRMDNTRWDRRFTELEAFIQRHGHARVPARWPENKDLATWVITQRQACRKGTLTPARLARLLPTGVLDTLRKRRATADGTP